jgi:enoyl-CoA hydratase/carnithine racemase
MKWVRARGLGTLAGAFVALGVTFGLVGAALIVRQFGRAGADIGKSLMSLGVALLVSGAAAVVVKKMEEVSADRTVWAGLLTNVVEVDETLEVARRLIAAHKTAKTYSEQYGNIVRGKLKLRQVSLDPLVVRAPDRAEIQGHLISMMKWIDELGSEYEDKYLHAARQQRIDEAYSRKYEDRAVDGAKRFADQRAPLGIQAISAYYDPTRAWAEIERFERLTSFIGPQFATSDFYTAYKAVKPLLDEHAGMGKRPEGQAYEPHVV